VNLQRNRSIHYLDLGVIDYKKAWDYQTSLFEKNIAVKTANRSVSDERQTLTDNFLLFCEHPHVYTLGKSGKPEHLLVNDEQLAALNASFYHINRGGDITYHGPGQIVVYPVIDLENFFTDIHRYMRFLEESVIRTCRYFGVQAGRVDGLTGVWVDFNDASRARKICALGVKTSRWVTMHGLAFNVNTDLDYFSHIIPCGIPDKAVTSLAVETGAELDMKAVGAVLKQCLCEVFEMEAV
jgi:lipoyl(octanoyl) transferase